MDTQMVERIPKPPKEDVIKSANGEKCQRCWTVLPEVSSNKNNLCKRCDDVWKSLQQ